MACALPNPLPQLTEADLDDVLDLTEEIFQAQGRTDPDGALNVALAEYDALKTYALDWDRAAATQRATAQRCFSLATAA